MGFWKFHWKNGGLVWAALYALVLLGSLAGLVEQPLVGNAVMLGVGVLMAVLNRDVWKKIRR